MWKGHDVGLAWELHAANETKTAKKGKIKYNKNNNIDQCNIWEKEKQNKTKFIGKLNKLH